MTWDEYTIESPSFNAVDAGTMIRLPASTWTKKVLDVNPPEAATGSGDAPTKAEAAMYQEGVVFTGEFSDKTAQDTAIWNPTIINGVSRTALGASEELRDLLDATKKAWSREPAAGNWHNDGSPTRATGQCRIRLGNKWSGGAGGSKVPYYIYGYVRHVVFGPNDAAQKSSGKMKFTLEFGYAQVEQA